MGPLLALVVLQKPQESKLVSIPSTVQPLDPLPELKGAKVLSRSGYTIPGQPKVGRVFRYSIRGDMEGFLRTFRSTRKAKDGWKVTQRTAAQMMFERDIAGGRLANQTFLVQKARIVPDPAGRVGIRVIPADKAPGWLWISYNEHVRTR